MLDVVLKMKVNANTGGKMQKQPFADVLQNRRP